MILFHVAFAMGLLALVAGTWLLVWVSKQEGGCKGFATFSAYAVIVLAFLSLVCLGWSGLRYGLKGCDGKSRGCMMGEMKGGMHGSMMKHMMGAHKDQMKNMENMPMNMEDHLKMHHQGK